MERAKPPLPLREKLTVAAAIDFPTASEILVSFPDRWELVSVLKREDQPLYVVGFPSSQEQGQADQFYGLPAAINRSLTTYRLYKLFEPWPQPTILVDWDEAKGEGWVGGGRLRILLQPVGQAQAWAGPRFGVLWECFLHGARRSETWQEALQQFWQTVERDLGVSKIFTTPHEPTFEEGYTEFLTGLGYGPDPEFER